MNLSLLLRFYRPNCAYTITADGKLIWQDKSLQPTDIEIQSWIASYELDLSKQNCKNQAQILLNESDFADLYTVRQKLENINEWDTYREIIRELRINPIENPTFPNKPQTIWKES